ncbi:DNA methyltransferase [Corynebacterium ulcerans]|uniref:DNA methyltransferase n=1 Tax=Corynebacterium ulcerans TaxID=65058 RepID=UPI000C794461|nr:DNA methyltransferase [Corynebacterium ulcerans]PLW01259.1 SAM-dependent methyltransferase [Corynebacterium ulcerans]
MARLNLRAVEERVTPLGNRESYDKEIIFELLLAYGKPKGNVTRLRSGSLNVAADPLHEVAQKNVVYFRETSGDALQEIEELRLASHVTRYTPRFIIVTDYNEFLAVDTKTGENLITPVRDIDKHFTFFLPWAGMEKAQYVAEAHADVKAAEKMGKLFDELLTTNKDLLSNPGGHHSLNVFFSRLLFCFFAEDTGIFTENQFTNAIGSHTLENGSDVHEVLSDIFLALDTPDPSNKPNHLASFPYVNGRLFTVRESDVIPRFTKKARKLLIDLGTLLWQEINPDIFGSMFQAVVKPDQRADLGQHYTSVPNILKTIEPLFLDDLRAEFDKGFSSVKKLEALLERISKIKIFDPACGSGNFLVIAYKELRRLEHAILERMGVLSQKHHALWTHSVVNIENFYGIDTDDFAVETAILSLWIAKHQMNSEFREKFGVELPLIPLKEIGRVTVGNAARMDWNSVCPNDGASEIYLIGNPPYLGSSLQKPHHKEDMAIAFAGYPYAKAMDYISIWFYKGTNYIKDSQARLAFVSTNSVVQGQHVEMMFPFIFDASLEIGYAYTSFKWENNAKKNAGVTVVVVSLRAKVKEPKWIFTDGLQISAKNINPYLADASDQIVLKRTKPLVGFLPKMTKGSQPTDAGNLLLTLEEKERLESEDPRISKYIKRYCGAEEYIKGKDRFCVWVKDSEDAEAKKIPALSSRFDAVATFRSKRKKTATKKLATVPFSFTERRYKETDSIIVPRVSSESRAYIPIGYLDSGYVISDAAFALYDAEPWLFALLTSRMHMAWARAVAGKLKTDYRYSNSLVYNNFPVPTLSEKTKGKLGDVALRVLDVREYFYEKTLAEIYDSESMPKELRQAHRQVDDLVDSIYARTPFASDEERLALLFKLYEEMIEAEQQKAVKK